MKILNIITLLTLTILPIVSCSKKANEPVEQKNKDNENKVYDFEIRNLEKIRFLTERQDHDLLKVEIRTEENINANIDKQLPNLKNVKIFSLEFNAELVNNIIKQKDLNSIAFQINSTPRKSLSYKRPIDLIQLF